MLVRCPQCGLPAEITDRFTLAGTSGPVEHVRTMCAGGHWFTPLVDDVEELVMPASPLLVDDLAIRRRAAWTRPSRSPKREPCRPLPPPTSRTSHRPADRLRASRGRGGLGVERR
jgi:hypothetical protein